MAKILFLSNHFITLYSFRKELIHQLCEDGHEVYLSLPSDDENIKFEEMGCQIVPTDIDRRGVNPLKDFNLIRQYKKIIPEVAPDIIFSYTIKPNIYGTWVSNRLGVRQICNVTGTGATFLKPGFVRTVATVLYRHSMKKCYKVFFQNTSDKAYFIQHRMIRDNWAMLPGSGCNLVEHPYAEMPKEDTVQFLFIGRVMALKGIDEYLSCAKEIRAEFPNTRFLIAGWNEEEKYQQIVAEYEKAGVVEYIGFRKDINEWIVKSHCVILPSHGGEGVPNSLLEAAAIGRPCIGARIGGITDVIDDGVTGYLFEAGSAADLADKVHKFLNLSQEEKQVMGQAGRKKVEQKFDRKIVMEAYLQEIKMADK